MRTELFMYFYIKTYIGTHYATGERGGSVVECRTPEREVRGSRPTAAVLCPWARHFTPRKYWLITQEAMAPSRHDWKIVDWDVKPQHNQPTNNYATDCSKPIVLVLFLFCVGLWFLLRGVACWVFALLFDLVFFSPFSIVITSLG